MNGKDTKHDRGELERYVYCTLPRCPSCNSSNLKAYHSTDNGDGSRTRYVRCECGRRLILVLE